MADSIARMAFRTVLPMFVGDRADVVPVAAVGDGEAVVLGEVGEFLVAVHLHRGGVLLVVDVGDPLQEDQREDVLLVVAGVDEAAQDDGGAPQVGLQLALGDSRTHADSPHFASSASRAERVSAALAWAASRSASACSSVSFSPVSAGAT